MLERIGNISLDADFKKSKKSRYRAFKGNLYSGSKFEINDSISFSPASKYLSRANWLLKEFHQSQDGKIEIEFSYMGFLFEANLDLETLNLINLIVYKVSRSDTNFLLDKKLSAVFKVSIGGKSENIPVQKELKGLEQLFQRFSTLELNRELNRYNYELIDTLLEGMYTSLQNDFEYLNSTLLQFLDKQTNKMFGTFSTKFQDKDTEIVLQKIKPIVD